MICPRCGLHNPSSAQSCDCGTDLTRDVSEELARERANAADRHYVMLFVGLAIALVAGAASWVTIQGAMEGRSDTVVVWHGAVVFGLAMFLYNLHGWFRNRNG